jgi:uncharacterized protein (DUF58 family)
MLSPFPLAATTRDLRLVVSHVLAGLGQGIHTGHERGAGVEFSEYRAYAPGDDVRRVDWKLTARADRYYVREAERDSHVAVWLWLDATASMAEPSRVLGAAQAGLDKLWFARAALACAAAVAQRQGDAVGLAVVTRGELLLTRPARGAGQLGRILAQLQNTGASGAAPAGESLMRRLHFARAPSLVLAASDFLDAPNAQLDALVRLARMRHDVRVLCLQTQAERDAAFAAGQVYTDPEVPDAGHVLTPDNRGVYRRNRDRHFAAVMQQLRRHGVPAVNCAIEEGLEAVLRQWLRPELRPERRP